MCVISPCAKSGDGRRIRARRASGGATGKVTCGLQNLRCRRNAAMGAPGDPDPVKMVPCACLGVPPGPSSHRSNAVWHGESVRYIVIGAGAVGGSIGAALFQAGKDVL